MLTCPIGQCRVGVSMSRGLISRTLCRFTASSSLLPPSPALPISFCCRTTNQCFFRYCPWCTDCYALPSPSFSIIRLAVLAAGHPVRVVHKKRAGFASFCVFGLPAPIRVPPALWVPLFVGPFCRPSVIVFALSWVSLFVDPFCRPFAIVFTLRFVNGFPFS